MPVQNFAEVIAEGHVEDYQVQRECTVCLEIYGEKEPVRVTICGKIKHFCMKNNKHKISSMYLVISNHNTLT
jgi:hypothetical protein